MEASCGIYCKRQGQEVVGGRFVQTIRKSQGGLSWVDAFNQRGSFFTPPRFNMDPEKWCLEDYFPFGKVYFQGLC